MRYPARFYFVVAMPVILALILGFFTARLLYDAFSTIDSKMQLINSAVAAVVIILVAYLIMKFIPYFYNLTKRRFDSLLQAFDKKIVSQAYDLLIDADYLKRTHPEQYREIAFKVIELAEVVADEKNKL